MEWPLHRRPVPDDQIPIWSHYFLAACSVPSDPTMIWGTDVPVGELKSYLGQANAESDVLITPVHLLLRAVGRALAKHPAFNRRIVRRRLYEFKNVSVLTPVRDSKGHPDLVLLRDVDRKSLVDVAGELWQRVHGESEGGSMHRRDERVFRRAPRLVRELVFRFMLREVNWLNIPAAFWGYRLRCPSAMVTYLGHRGAPPMRTFKPARFPNDACTIFVAMGPTEHDGVNRPVAPLFVRADHRVVDNHELGEFVATVRSYLADPATMEAAATAVSTAAAPGSDRTDQLP